MPTEEANREQLDKAKEVMVTIELLVDKFLNITDELNHVNNLISTVVVQFNALSLSTDVEEVREVSAHVVEEANAVESTAISEDNMLESNNEEIQSKNSEISDARLYEPDKKVVKENALKEKILDTVCVFGRKFKDLTFREILNREGGEDFVRRLAKSQSMLAEDCSYLVKCIEEEAE